MPDDIREWLAAKTADPDNAIALQASTGEATESAQQGTGVAGFGAFHELLVQLNITARTFVGGTTPTSQIDLYLQRLMPDGTSWDDVLAFQSTAGLAAVTETLFGEFRSEAVTPGAPAAVQDQGGSPAFAPRVAMLTETLRVAWVVVTTGSPSSFVLTFEVSAVGRS